MPKKPNLRAAAQKRNFAKFRLKGTVKNIKNALPYVTITQRAELRRAIYEIEKVLAKW